MTNYVPTITRIGHIALFVNDPEASAKWYGDVLAMRRIATADGAPYRGGIFLSFGDSDHDIGLFKHGTAPTVGVEFEHIGFELQCPEGLETLRQFHAMLQRKRVRIHEILDHGVSKGIYFFDPDGHMLEVYYQQLSGETARTALAENHGLAAPFELLTESS